MQAGNLKIYIDKRGMVVFQYVMNGNQHTLEATPDQARQIGNGFLKASDALQPQRKLYAIATEKVVVNDQGQRQWVPGGVEFLHADNEQQAKLVFWGARPQTSKQEIRIVALGPAITGSESPLYQGRVH